MTISKGLLLLVRNKSANNMINSINREYDEGIPT